MLLSRCDDEEETHLLTRQGIVNLVLTVSTPCGSAFPHRSGLSTGTKEKQKKTNPAEEKTFSWLQEIFRHSSCSQLRIILEVSTVPSRGVRQRLSGQSVGSCLSSFQWCRSSGSLLECFYLCGFGDQPNYHFWLIHVHVLFFFFNFLYVRAINGAYAHMPISCHHVMTHCETILL